MKSRAGETTDEPEGDNELAQDAEDFDNAAADLEEDSNVTSIGFGGEAAS